MSILDERQGLFKNALLVGFGTGILRFNLKIFKVVNSFHELHSMSMECVAATAFEYFVLFSSDLSLQNNSIFNLFLYKES